MSGMKSLEPDFYIFKELILFLSLSVDINVTQLILFIRYFI